MKIRTTHAKHFRNFLAAAIFMFGIAAYMLHGSLPAQAASATNSYAPASQSLANGANVTMVVTTNAGSNHVLTDQLRITYDAAKLKFISVSYAGSPLDQSAPEESSGTGFYQVARYTLGTKPTGSFTLATLTFQALVSSGSAVVGADAGNSSIYIQEDGGTTNALTGSATATYMLTAPPDTTKPSVSLTAPTNGATISGKSVALTATASDNTAVTKVEFYADSTLKSTATTAPYAGTLDTTSLTDGTHSLTAKAYDAAGNNASSAVSVTVKNNATVPSTSQTTTPTTSSTTASTNKTTTTPAASASSSSSSTPATTAGVQPAATSPYKIDALPDTGTTAKSKKISAPVIAGLSVAVLAAAAVGALLLVRSAQSRRNLAGHLGFESSAAFASNPSPAGRPTLFAPSTHPTQPANVPGTEVHPSTAVDPPEATVPPTPPTPGSTV